MTAMTAATIDQLSDGRMLLGIGSSGPQVAEGWHGQRFAQPAAAHARVRRRACGWRWPASGSVSRRDARAAAARRAGQGAEAHDRAGAGADPDLHRRDRAEEHDAGGRDRRRLAADAVLPRARRRVPAAARGGLRARRRRQGLRRLRHRPDGHRDGRPTTCESARDAMRHYVALYVGGMGSRKQNFYNALVRRYGFEDAAREVQDLYLEGRKDEAAAALPGELIDTRVRWSGRADVVRERLRVYRDAGVGHADGLADGVDVRGPAGAAARGGRAGGVSLPADLLDAAAGAGDAPALTELARAATRPTWSGRRRAGSVPVAPPDWARALPRGRTRWSHCVWDDDGAMLRRLGRVPARRRRPLLGGARRARVRAPVALAAGDRRRDARAGRGGDAARAATSASSCGRRRAPRPSSSTRARGWRARRAPRAGTRGSGWRWSGTRRDAAREGPARRVRRPGPRVPDARARARSCVARGHEVGDRDLAALARARRGRRDGRSPPRRSTRSSRRASGR